MSAAKSSTLSATPAARCTRVPAAGMKPDDSAVDPAGTASRSITTHSTPDRASRMAAVTQAPPPMMSTGSDSSGAGCASGPFIGRFRDEVLAGAQVRHTAQIGQRGVVQRRRRRAQPSASTVTW